jgi:hypothetical protein
MKHLETIARADLNAWMSGLHSQTKCRHNLRMKERLKSRRGLFMCWGLKVKSKLSERATRGKADTWVLGSLARCTIAHA